MGVEDRGRSMEHQQWHGYRRLRRCLIFATALCATIWLITTTWDWEYSAGASQWSFLPMTRCKTSASFSSINGQRSKIGKATMVYGGPNEVYDRTLASHERHAAQHGYPMFVLKEELFDGIWSKLVYMMTMISNELQKPLEQRLEWVFWHDADTYILNPNVALETFLPPATDLAFQNISFMVANDHIGLQAGSFFLRVDSWSIELLSAAIALPRYRPDMYLKHLEQTALEYLADPQTDSTSILGIIGQDSGAEYFHQRTATVPQRWFNAYLGWRHMDGTPLPPAKQPVRMATYGVQEGDLLIHSSSYGVSKMKGMAAFMANVERDPARWAKPAEQTGLREEAAAFWQRWKLDHPVA